MAVVLLVVGANVVVVVIGVATRNKMFNAHFTFKVKSNFGKT